MTLRDVILWILSIVAILLSLWYLFGSSPTFEQAILVLILTILFALGSKMSTLGERFLHMQEKFSRLESSFIRLVGDFRKQMRKRG